MFSSVIIYINSLPENINLENSFGYADDFKVEVIAKSKRELDNATALSKNRCNNNLTISMLENALLSISKMS